MTIIVEFTIPAEHFALAESLSRVPDVTVEVDNVVAHDAEQIIPCFWAFGDERETFEQAARDDPSIENLSIFDEQEGATLYQADWTDEVVTVVKTITQMGATLVKAIGQDDHWMLELRFTTSDGLTAFTRYLDETAPKAELQRLYRSANPTMEYQPCLTDIQHETLITALKEGYYETPRELTMSELADEFDISQQALSKRLRGAHRTLVENSLALSSKTDSETDQES